MKDKHIQMFERRLQNRAEYGRNRRGSFVV